MIRILVEQYGDFVREAFAALPQGVANIFSGGVSSEGGRQVVSRSAVGGSPKGTQFGFLGYAEQQLLQQYILDQQARAGTQQNIRDKSTVLNPLQRAAIRKQEEFEKARRESIRKSVPGRLAFTKTKQPVAQLGRGRVGKKKAGRSQIAERRNLSATILAQSKRLKRATGGLAIQLTNSIRVKQQKLINLLARYTF